MKYIFSAFCVFSIIVCTIHASEKKDQKIISTYEKDLTALIKVIDEQSIDGLKKELGIISGSHHESIQRAFAGISRDPVRNYDIIDLRAGVVAVRSVTKVLSIKKHEKTLAKKGVPSINKDDIFSVAHRLYALIEAFRIEQIKRWQSISNSASRTNKHRRLHKQSSSGTIQSIY